MSAADLCPEPCPALDASGATSASATLRVALAPWRAWRRERRIRRDLASLREMDDRGLRDIGLDRGDLERAVRYGRD